MLADPTQLELLRDARGKLPPGSIFKVRSRGRPRGARNKRSKKIADYFVHKYGDPLDVLGELMTTPLDLLVAQMREAQGSGAKPVRAVEALSLQIVATRTALEYVHGKQPVSVEVTSKADLVMFVPEIMREHGINPDELKAAIEERGLEAFDAETLRLNPPEEADFEEVESGDD